MDYFIRNNKVYIRLNENGKAETCVKNHAQRFEYSKAKNVIASLPKPLKRMNFKTEAIPEISERPSVTLEKACEPKLICDVKETHVSVQTWVERIKGLNGLADDALQRKTELASQLSTPDKRKVDMEHEIEFAAKVNACNGYKMFRELKDLLEQRRIVKDELLIVDTILRSDFGKIAAGNIQKCVDGLSTRKYMYRNQEPVKLST